jgi:hypothetical protein
MNFDNSIKNHTMKTNALYFLVLFYLGLFLISSCSKSNDRNNSRLVNSVIKPNIEISSGDTLRVDLGNFGDEEGVSIIKNPRNAKVSKTFRALNSNSILYEYLPLEKFKGSDTAVLIIDRRSDGTNAGFKDTTKICIIVN